MNSKPQPLPSREIHTKMENPDMKTLLTDMKIRMPGSEKNPQDTKKDLQIIKRELQGTKSQHRA
jgi:hypothetical protein